MDLHLTLIRGRGRVQFQERPSAFGGAAGNRDWHTILLFVAGELLSRLPEETPTDLPADRGSILSLAAQRIVNKFAALAVLLICLFTPRLLQLLHPTGDLP